MCVCTSHAHARRLLIALGADVNRISMHYAFDGFFKRRRYNTFKLREDTLKELQVGRQHSKRMPPARAGSRQVLTAHAAARPPTSCSRSPLLQASNMKEVKHRKKAAAAVAKGKAPPAPPGGKKGPRTNAQLLRASRERTCLAVMELFERRVSSRTGSTLCSACVHTGDCSVRTA